MMNLLWVVLGLLLLVKGAEFLIQGSANIAARFRIPPLLIGLTLVAFGTSSPELAVSVDAAFAGQAGVGLGNVVGSNIFNVLFILGVCGLVAPLMVSSVLIRWDLPIMLAASLLTWLFAADGALDWWEGVLLMAGLAAYLVSLVYRTRANPAPDDMGFTLAANTAMWRHGLMAVLGLALLVLGSKLMVKGAVAIALMLGVSELVIGLTLVAAATSLPEVMTSLVATVKGQRDIAVGNVIGSNIFNLLGVLGVAAWVSPEPMAVPRVMLQIDMPLMVMVALICLPVFFTGHQISRVEAGGLLTLYIAYTSYLALSAIGSPVSHWVYEAVKMLSIPLTLLLIAKTADELRGESVG